MIYIIGSTAAKSSRSIDSGVLLDQCRSSSDDKGRQKDEIIFNAGSSSSNNNNNDELLCQRVENAVRKFTEELILCERRTRDRSRSSARRRLLLQRHRRIRV